MLITLYTDCVDLLEKNVFAYGALTIFVQKQTKTTARIERFLIQAVSFIFYVIKTNNIKLPLTNKLHIICKALAALDLLLPLYAKRR